MSIKKTLVGIVLASALSGCDVPEVPNKNKIEASEEPKISYEFNDFGLVRDDFSSEVSFSHLSGSITTADIDGDGDQDIIYYYVPQGKIFVLENKMPQKKYESK